MLVFGLAFDVPNTFSHIDRHKHAFGRRILNYAFSSKSIQALQGKIIVVADRLNDILLSDGKENSICKGPSENGWSSPKNISELFGYAVSDLINEICYSRSWDMMGSETNRDLTDAFKAGAGAVSIVSLLLLFQTWLQICVVLASIAADEHISFAR